MRSPRFYRALEHATYGIGVAVHFTFNRNVSTNEEWGNLNALMVLAFGSIQRRFCESPPAPWTDPEGELASVVTLAWISPTDWVTLRLRATHEMNQLNMADFSGTIDDVHRLMKWEYYQQPFYTCDRASLNRRNEQRNLILTNRLVDPS